MSVLSPIIQQNAEELLVRSGLISDADLKSFKLRSGREHTPLFGLLLKEKKISDEDLAKTLATINQVPYVNLSQARVEPAILKLLPHDIAEHYMAVPLGEAQGKLVVAMLEADNIQAADFLSSKIGRPLKVYAAAESGIRHVLKQYEDSGLDSGLKSILGQADQISSTRAEIIAPNGNDTDVQTGAKTTKAQTIVQRSE